jgi:hypothetical protein
MVCDASQDLSRSLLVASNVFYLVPPVSLWLARGRSLRSLNEYDVSLVASLTVVFLMSSLFHACKADDCTSWCLTSFIQTEYVDSMESFLAAIVLSFSGVSWTASRFLSFLFLVELVAVPALAIHAFYIWGDQAGFALVGIGLVASNVGLRYVVGQFALVPRVWPFALSVLVIMFVTAVLTQYQNVTTLSYEYTHTIWHIATALGAAAVPWLAARNPDTPAGSSAYAPVATAETQAPSPRA